MGLAFDGTPLMPAMSPPLLLSSLEQPNGIFRERAESSSSSPSATFQTSISQGPSSTLSSSSGIFNFPSASPTTVRPPTEPGHQSKPQLVLEWIFAIAAVAVLVLLLFCRYTHLRRRGRPVSQLFSHGRPQRAPSPSARPFHHSIRHPYNYPSLPLNSNDILPSQPLTTAILSDALFTIPTLPQAPPPSGRHRRTVRGADTDEGGRREGGPDPDTIGEGDAKELLPAYDSGSNGPPKYAEVLVNQHLPGASRHEAFEMMDMGHPQQPLLLAGEGIRDQSPQSHLSLEGSINNPHVQSSHSPRDIGTPTMPEPAHESHNNHPGRHQQH